MCSVLNTNGSRKGGKADGSGMLAEDRRLRVGYLSADFKDHPVAKRMQDVYASHDRWRVREIMKERGRAHVRQDVYASHDRSRVREIMKVRGRAHRWQDVYASHDRSRVRVTCYSLNADDGSPWRAKIRASAERFIDLDATLQQGGPHAVASAIAGDFADVLVNLAGHTRGNDAVTVVMAHRPSPVQVMHEGYAGTMGGARHTAHMTDRFSSPPDYAGHYVEKLLYMPHTFFVNDHKQTYPELTHDIPVEGEEKASRLAFGHLPADLPFVFAAFNQEEARAGGGTASLVALFGPLGDVAVLSGRTL
ncbi:glycosyl transferase family 41-domain-containing protein [Baffinella frigidus]|nr:glycosyl transferase family 41-domain-containing protein [Cryptophyta sp. CCMP2293]